MKYMLLIYGNDELWASFDPDDMAEIVDGAEQGSVQTVDVPLPGSVTGSTFRFRLTGIRPVVTYDWVSDNEVDQPAAIAEIGPLDVHAQVAEEIAVGGLDPLPFPARVRLGSESGELNAVTARGRCPGGRCSRADRRSRMPCPCRAAGSRRPRSAAA